MCLYSRGLLSSRNYGESSFPAAWGPGYATSHWSRWQCAPVGVGALLFFLEALGYNQQRKGTRMTRLLNTNIRRYVEIRKMCKISAFRSGCGWTLVSLTPLALCTNGPWIPPQPSKKKKKAYPEDLFFLNKISPPQDFSRIYRTFFSLTPSWALKIKAELRIWFRSFRAGFWPTCSSWFCEVGVNTGGALPVCIVWVC